MVGDLSTLVAVGGAGQYWKGVIYSRKGDAGPEDIHVHKCNIT